MYRIRRPDGVEEGPHPVGVLQLWMRTGRITRATPARLETDAIWKPLGEFPAFAAPTHAGPPPPPLPDSDRNPSVPPPQPRLSRLAVASLVCGSLGFLVLPGVVGLILGFVALVSIRRSGGQLRGRGIAATGVLLSLILTVGTLLLVGVVFNASMQPRGQGISRSGMPQPADPCRQNLSELGLSLRQYANDHGDVLPVAASWCDAVRDYVPSLSVFQCPGARTQAATAFALNSQASGLNLEQLDPSTVLLFEAPGAWNNAGGPELPGKGRRGRNLAWVYHANGDLKRVPINELPGLRWTP